MQPNANSNVVDNAPQAATPQTAPVNQGNMVTQSSKSKKNTGMIIGMAILAVLAAGGIGFGVWAFLSGNQKEAKLNDQISELNSKLAERESTENEQINDGDSFSQSDFGFVAKNAAELGDNNSMVICSLSYTDICFTLSLDGNVKADYYSVDWSRLEESMRQYERKEEDLTGIIDGRVVDMAFGHIGNGAYGVAFFLLDDGTVMYMQEEDILSQKYNARVLSGANNVVGIYGNKYNIDCAGFVKDGDGNMKSIVLDGFGDDGMTVNLKVE